MRILRQKEAVDSFTSSPGRYIINACPRFGKIKVALDILENMNIKEVTLLAPRTDIFQGWKSDISKFGSKCIFTYHTFMGIKNIKSSNELIIIDEPHELSINQQKTLAKVAGKVNILGLTGTMTDKTRHELYDNLQLTTCYYYPIEKGVEEGILSDYIINIHSIDLNNKIYSYSSSKGRYYTELGKIKSYIKARENIHSSQKWFMDLKIINFLQNSVTKREFTKRLLESYKDERVLVFCGVVNTANGLDIPVYHSKSKDENILKGFCNGTSDNPHLATIKMMQAGITVKPINRGVLNYTSGNPEETAQKICRFLAFEYDNPEKIAKIDIISSSEPFELNRIKIALSFFDKSKIFYKSTEM